MTPTVLRFADRPVTGWKNGGGVTRPIAAAPDGSDVETFDWRVSVADVSADGAFSTFPGVDRIIMLCDGASMELDIAGVGRPLSRHVPFAFDGADAVSCRVAGGATRDLNVMTRRGRCTATMRVLPAVAATIAAGAGRTTLAMSLTGGDEVRDASGAPVRLDAFDTVWLPAATALHVSGTGPLAVIEIAC